jgi:hypothetical protein
VQTNSIPSDHHAPRELEGEELSPDLQLEYLGAKGSVAIATGDNGLAQEAIEGLKAMNINAPFWAEQRGQVLIEMLEFLHRPGSAAPATRQRKIVKLLLSMNEILHLKPNLFGIGVNVNQVVEKLARRFDADRRV